MKFSVVATAVALVSGATASVNHQVQRNRGCVSIQVYDGGYGGRATINGGDCNNASDWTYPGTVSDVSARFTMRGDYMHATYVSRPEFPGRLRFLGLPPLYWRRY